MHPEGPTAGGGRGPKGGEGWNIMYPLEDEGEEEIAWCSPYLLLRLLGLFLVILGGNTSWFKLVCTFMKYNFRIGSHDKVVTTGK